MSAAALSAGMPAVAPAASAVPSTQNYSNNHLRGVDCDELMANYNPRVKHTRSDSKAMAECKKRKHGKH